MDPETQLLTLLIIINFSETLKTFTEQCQLLHLLYCPNVPILLLNQTLKQKTQKWEATLLFLHLRMKRTQTPSRAPFKMEIYVISPACRLVYSRPPQPPTALCIKGNPRSPQPVFLHTLLRGYPQWKELLLPVLKHQLGSLRLGAVRGERRNGQLVIAALWGFVLRRQQARGNKVSGKKGPGVWSGG